MAQSYANDELIPALITALEGITIQSGDQSTVANVERWDPVRRDSSSLAYISVRFLRARRSYTNTDCDWLVTGTVQVDAVVALDVCGARRGDEILCDFEFDIAKAIAAAGADFDKADLESIDTEIIQDDESPELRVVSELTLSWTEDPTTGANTGPV